MKKSFSKKNKKGKGMPLVIKICIPMIMLSILQLAVLVFIMFFSGEFSTIKKYAYNILAEKTENRANYIENALNQKTALVYETANEVNSTVEKILSESGKDISDIKTDKELDKLIISENADNIISLIRRNVVNDAYIILDSDFLFGERNGYPLLSGLYLRDNDVEENDFVKNKDLLVEMGSTELSRNLGITMDRQWTLYINLTDEESFDFIHNPVENQKANPTAPVYNSGYWSGLSRIYPTGSPSIKYSIPLVSSDNVVYGVIGIGILEKDILNMIPSNDFLNNSACYILGTDIDGNGIYKTQLHSGAAFSKLVTSKTVFDKSNKDEYNLYSYNTKYSSVGYISDINIYSPSSLFKNQKWVLISVADSEKILEIYHTLVNTFITSSVLCMVLCIIFALTMSRRVTRPVSGMIKTLKKEPDIDGILEFAPSGITEIDTLASSIIDLQAEMREQSMKVSNILSMSDSGIGVFMYEGKGKTVFVGKSLVKILEFPDVPTDKDITISFEQFKNYVADLCSDKNVFENGSFLKELDEKFEIVTEQLYRRRNTNSSKWLRFTITRDSGGNVMGLVQDITKSVIERKKIEHERDYDVTTGLFNRRAFYANVEQLFANPQNLGVGAFIMLDLDNLKFVNDTYGHDFGDDYIRTMANLLKKMLCDNVIAARLSGDEFIVFLHGFKSKEQARQLIDNFRQSIAESYCILSDGNHYKIRASGGISWYPDDSVSYETLIKYADFAMYTIKHSTKGSIAEFDKSSYTNDSILVTGIEEMNRIIDSGDIKYAFQSIIDAKTGEIYGYEALMRPQSKNITSVLEFIRIAKASAKLYEIERLTWFLALKSYNNNRKKGLIASDVKLFINSISNCQLDERSVENIESAYGDILDHIVMEVLESEQTNKNYAENKQKMIAKWKGKIALDDFGTGYNSEYALITMNPDIIKIDRSIISECNKDASKATIISNLVSLAQSNNIMVLAEGVETSQEMETVIKYGVNLIQGYYISCPRFEPVPVDEKIKQEVISLSKKYNADK